MDLAEIKEEISKLKSRIEALEKRVAEHDVQYAVINTKLSAILWVLGAIGTAVIGILVKFLFGGV